VSRGQLVEIGGGFRIPEVMAAGGARMVEVGTTNRTRLSDYRAAVDEDTAMILRVHTSNFRVVGFTEEASLEELVGLGRDVGLPVVDDLGSGSMLDTQAFGLASEPVVGESIETGAALATFSGDKLLGGPQAGIIVGRTDIVARLRAHPFTRALRPGKTTLAGLHATLLHYLRGEAAEKVPVWRMIAAQVPELEARAKAWADAACAAGADARLTPGRSATGGGSLPGETLPTMLLAVYTDRPDALANALRHGDPPIVAKIGDGVLTLDPRTVLPEEDASVAEALRQEGSPVLSPMSEGESVEVASA
jgi:L-seryl-tRNA(Ser) seleniumtransferase